MIKLIIVLWQVRLSKALICIAGLGKGSTGLEPPAGARNLKKLSPKSLSLILDLALNWEVHLIQKV